MVDSYVVYFRFDCCFVFDPFVSLNLFSVKYPSEMASDIMFDFCFHETVIHACEVDLLLAIVDTKTKDCHGTVNVIRVVPSASEKLIRKRKRVTRNRNVKVQKVFLCDHCDYESNAKYMIDRHLRRIHEESAEKHKCKLCNFTSMYPYSIKRHVTRTHQNVEMSSESSSITVRTRRTVIQETSSSCNSERDNVGRSLEIGSVNSFWAM